MAVFKDGKRVDGGPSDRHYQILASHGHTDAIPAARLSEFVAAPAPRVEKGGIFNSGYTGFRDMFDGGGPGRSGAMFSSKSLDNYGVDPGGYVSQAAINKMQATNPGQYKADFGTGIGGLSNRLGFRPYGSYAAEAALPAGQGINIGTSGLGSIMAGAANPFLQMLGFNNKSMVNPNLPLGAILNPAPAPKPVSSPINQPAPPIPTFEENEAAYSGSPVQAIMNGGLVGLRRYMYGGMV